MRRAAGAMPATARLATPPVVTEQAAAGQPGKLDWFGEWWPVAFVRDIPDKQPYAFTLLEQPM